MKIKYISPKIKVVKLDPEQALIQICVIGGAYMSPGRNSCVETGTTIVTPCPGTVRGQQGSWQMASPVPESSPS
ncbi:MAG: hypothetical protein PHQ52_05295 [Candidatus Omnitrophica bacterium]|nr:hypothetical protein [Candidatus Omnitrophota bacterium]